MKMTNFLPLRMLPMLSQDTGAALSIGERLRLLLLTPLYVVLGVSVLASSPILALASKTSRTAKHIIYFICLRTVIPTLRYFLDTVPTWLVLTWWLRSKNIAQDGLRVMKDVALGEPCAYGRHAREWAQCLHPIGSSRKYNTDRIVLYCHGGGHLAANCVLLMPSVTPWARAGYTVWCMNYPLTPETIFPEAVCSVMRCIKWLAQEYDIKRLALAGDSAGGNLATMAAALVTNPRLREKLPIASEFEQGFPEILGVISKYGLLDRTSFFENETVTISQLETALSRFALDFIFTVYTGDENFRDPVPAAGKPMEGRCTLCDYIDIMETYPKTFLVVGKRDVLVHSSRKAHRMLLARGIECELHEYDARHAFVGLPPALNVGGTWRHHSKPATEKMIQFFNTLNWQT